MRDYVCISLYTAARKGNVLTTTWKDINWEKKTWEIPNTKNGKPHVIPLIATSYRYIRKKTKRSRHKRNN
ncbi:MAG: tyrosine-type recombinase/integrase [Rickettsia aeschlimannii]